jgi:hypothetical protein
MPLSPARVLRTFRYAVHFDGVDDYVALFTTNYPSITVVTWARLAVPWWPPPGWRAIVSKGWAHRADGVGGLYALSPAGYGGWLRDSAGIVYDVTAFGLPSLVEGFHCIALTSEARLYVDSVLRKTTTIPNPLNANTYPWNVGRDPIEVTRVFPGYVAQVLIYSRALTDSEILWNYINPDNPIRNGLVLWLQADPAYVKDIDGDGVPEWLDLSGFDNHGKIYGARLVELIKTPARTLPVARALPTAR